MAQLYGNSRWVLCKQCGRGHLERHGCAFCDKDAFSAAYEVWLRTHDPGREQFRPGNDVWAASHREPVIAPVNRVPLTARLAYAFLFGVVRPVCEAFAWAEAKWKGKR
jgi:hypothetical protein